MEGGVKKGYYVVFKGASMQEIGFRNNASDQMNHFALLRKKDLLRVGMKRLAWHVEESPQRLEYDHATGGKLPRNHLWRPYRFCVQDVLFGATVVRHAREYNCLEVDVFLAVEVPQYEPDSGARWLALFLLSEAYKCGGSMEIRFTEYVEGKRIPFALCQLAESVDAPFQIESIEQGRISPQEARNLFSKLTGFAPELQERIDELSSQHRLSIERVCYSIHHGVWSLNEIESMVLSSPYPDVVLSGEIQPEKRHLYSHILFQARSSLLGGFLDRKMALREHVDESGAAFNLEDDERNILVEFEAAIYAKWYSCPDESMPIPWLLDGQEYLVNPSDNIVVLIRARDAIGIKRYLTTDIDLVGERALQSIGERYFVLVPFDFNDPYISDDERQALANRAQSKQVGIMICPESVSTLDVDVRKRFMSSRIMRE